MKLAVSLQYALWDARRRKMAAARKAWYARTAPEWALPMVEVPDRGGSRESPEGLWETNRRGWRVALSDARATHVMVWQEDMEPFDEDHFWGVFGSAHSWALDQVVVLLCDRQSVARAVRENKPWVRLPDGTWGGTTIMPRALAEEFLAWEDRYIASTLRSADARVDLWLRRTERQAFAPAPSLVRHVGHVSLIGGARGRGDNPLLADRDTYYGPTTDFVQSGRNLNARMFNYLLEGA